MKKPSLKKAAVSARILRSFGRTAWLALLRRYIHATLCVYIFLILVVMPFYYEEGYAHIGTDKHTFFKNSSLYAAYVLLPLTLLYLLVLLGRRLSEKQAQRTGRPGRKSLRPVSPGSASGHKICFTHKAGFTYKVGLRAQSMLHTLVHCLRAASLTDRFALCFAAACVLSFACSDYQEAALWGAGGWYIGLIPQLMFLGGYFLVSRFWQPNLWLPGLLFPVSAAVFLLGCLNRFGIYPFRMVYASPGFISTIGNVNWYCGYLVTVFFAGVYLVWSVPSGKPRTRPALFLYLGLGFSSLVTQGSSSGLLALVGALLVLFCLSVRDGQKMQGFLQICLVFWLSCLLILGIRLLFPGAMTYAEALLDPFTFSILPVLLAPVSGGACFLVHRSNEKGRYPQKLFVSLRTALLVLLPALSLGFLLLLVRNTLRPGSIGFLSSFPVFSFSPDWGSSRGATWQAAFRLFLEQGFFKKWVGVGPDAMSAYLYTDAGAGLRTFVEEAFPNLRLTNAHNEGLTILVNQGLFGLLGLTGLLASAVWRYLKAGQEQKLPFRSRCVVGACGLCILAYFANNLVSFQQSMNGATMFLLLGIGEAWSRKRI
ncbi:MAG: O-antigen ligase family protein [Clostridium sp.]|jgi:hypothetical protein|nr:O-antigen ligase family protein [Clostridium sp.]